MGMQALNYDIKARRLGRLAEIDDEEIPNRFHVKPRPNLDKGKGPAIDLLACLQREVERTKERYDAACDDLRNYMRTNNRK